MAKAKTSVQFFTARASPEVRAKLTAVLRNKALKIAACSNARRAKSYWTAMALREAGVY